MPEQAGQGGGGCTPVVAVAEAKREFGANSEEVNLREMINDKRQR